MKRLGYQISSLAMVLLLIPSIASAQIRPPATSQPGQVQQRLKIEPARPDVGGASIISVPDAYGKTKTLKGDITFKLKDVILENLTVFSKEEISKEYAAYIGQEVSLATLGEIANKITVRYRNAGYILSRAVVPQSINNGIAKIRIVEGFVNKVVFEGDAAKTSLLNKYADKITNTKPLDAKSLERYLLLMEDLPGVSAQAVIRPAAGVSGASDVVVKIEERKVDGSATLDNRGTRFLGPIQAGVTANANNVLGGYDRTQFHGVITAEANELRYGQVVHEEQLGSEGTKLSIAAGYTETHPVYTLAQFDLHGRDTLVSATLSHPFIRSRQTNLYGNVEVEMHDSDVDALGSTLYRDKLRIARIGGSYDFVDGFSGVNKLESALSRGFNWGTSSNDPSSRVNGVNDFTKGTALVSRLQPVVGPFDVYLSASGQVSANTLLIGEQFGIGGSEFGSAYDPSEITGDSGVAARAELRYTRSGDFAIVPNYQFYGFYDIGKVWIRDTPTENEASLADAGLGLRFNAEKPLSGGIEFAAPLTRVVASNGAQDGYSPRVFFSLAYRY